jgi:glucose/arabinose dehydrogenase
MLDVTNGRGRQPGVGDRPQRLRGNILRVTPEGVPPPDNPIADSPVCARGRRDPQGIVWDDHGRLYASEFGHHTP